MIRIPLKLALQAIVKIQTRIRIFIAKGKLIKLKNQKKINNKMFNNSTTISVQKDLGFYDCYYYYFFIYVIIIIIII